MGIPANWVAPDGRARRRIVASPLFWMAAARALAELARARFRLAGLEVSDIETLNREAARKGRGSERGAPGDAGMADLVGFVLPRIAWRLPWRSDCLIQAMAAQHWMLGKGIESRIVVGVDKAEASGFESHAWLVYGDRIVTGGDVRRYQQVIGMDSRI